MPWTIDLASTGANLQKVTKLAVGVEGGGAAGKLFFDDIRLFPSVPATVDAGRSGHDRSGRLLQVRRATPRTPPARHHGTLAGNRRPFVAGKVGQALNMTADLTVRHGALLRRLGDEHLHRRGVGQCRRHERHPGHPRNPLQRREHVRLKVDADRVHGDIGNGTAWLNTQCGYRLPAQGGVLDVGDVAPSSPT